MKKWMFGCLGLFIVVAIAGGYGAYRFLYKPARDYVKSFTQLQVVPELNAQVANQAAFTAPANGVLNANTVERFVRAQQAMHARIGERVRELDAKYKALQGPSGTRTEPTFAEAVSALKDLTSLYVEAKRAQVEALNAERLSLAEYEWTRDRAYEALGLPIATTLQQVIREVSAGKAPDIESITNTPAAPVPEKNRELVQPFAKELTERAGLAFFAL
jgi:hypothetical protein